MTSGHGRGSGGAAARPALDPIQLQRLIHDPSEEVLRGVAMNPGLTEDLALALLKRRDLPGGVIEDLVKNPAVMKHRKVISAVVMHLRTPRHVSVSMVRRLYTFELMQVALSPAVPADIKRVADEQIILRLEQVSSGERLTLARRASGRVAEVLLLDPEPRIVEAALLNPRMTEAAIGKALLHDKSPVHFVEQVCRHPKWSLRREVQLALLQNDNTPLARVLAFAQAFSAALLRDILKRSRLSASVKMYLMEELSRREKGSSPPSS